MTVLNELTLYNNRGIANAILGNNEAAKTRFRKAIALDQFYFDPYVNRANLHIELQEIKLAQQDLSFVSKESWIILFILFNCKTQSLI